jgi:hypothetical protein
MGAEDMSEAATLWTLYRNSNTMSAEMSVIEGFGLELRYVRDGEPCAWIRFRDRSVLLNEATAERADLEADGWRLGLSIVWGSASPER